MTPPTATFGNEISFHSFDLFCQLDNDKQEEIRTKMKNEFELLVNDAFYKKRGEQ